MRTVRRGYVAVEEGPAMDKQFDVSTLAMLTTALEQRPEAEVRRALQAVIEGKPLGESSLDGKLIDYGRGCKAPADQFMVLNGVKYRRHVNGGGWVPADQDKFDPNKAYVSEKAYIAPRVIIEGNTRISGGKFHGGTFDGGQFHGGLFDGDRMYIYATIGKEYGSSEDADSIL